MKKLTKLAITAPLSALATATFGIGAHTLSENASSVTDMLYVIPANILSGGFLAISLISFWQLYKECKRISEAKKVTAEAGT